MCLPTMIIFKNSITRFKNHITTLNAQIMQKNLASLEVSPHLYQRITLETDRAVKYRISKTHLNT